MRPIRKGKSPLKFDFSKYQDAKNFLVDRLDLYCSYCERRVVTGLAVEHIEPKSGLNGKPELENKWTNFLLACVNCNSSKKDKKVDLQEILLPDRHNTFNAFCYHADGSIEPNPKLRNSLQKKAETTLKLVGLDKDFCKRTKNDNLKFVHSDLKSQRRETLSVAQNALQIFNSNPNDKPLQNIIADLALAQGFFSIWMAVFVDCPVMKIIFISKFKGTKESGCFDMATGNSLSPSPNLDELNCGGLC